ncbi:MAG: T9SS type A sorting domain-containing protein [Ferruginibacter sp.]
MKNILLILSCLTPAVVFGQARLVFNGADVSIINTAKLVIQNPAPAALTVMSGGGVINTGADNDIVWNIGNNAATYTVPFISNGNAIPVSFTTSGATGNGSLLLGTYAGPDWKNSSYLPPTVTNVNRSGADNSSYIIDRFWQIQPLGYSTNPSLSNLVFTYNKNEWNETGNTIIETEMNAQSWNATTGAWTFPGTGTDDAASNTLTVPMVNGTDLNAWWTLVDQASALPLTLLNLSVQKQNDNAILKWLVTNEVNVSYYEIQRSVNGIDFSAIEKLSAFNNGNINNNYSYSDPLSALHSNTVYYRLRMVDTDGKFSYSPVRTVSLTANEDMSIQASPNPVTNILLLRFGAVPAGMYRILITDAAGKKVLYKQVQATPNSVLYFNRPTNMAAGTYFITVSGENIQKTFTIIFQ